MKGISFQHHPPSFRSLLQSHFLPRLLRIISSRYCILALLRRDGRMGVSQCFGGLANIKMRSAGLLYAWLRRSFEDLLQISPLSSHQPRES